MTRISKIDVLSHKAAMLAKMFLYDRSVDMYFVSMEQSGTHWLRQMLAEYLIRCFDLDFRAENLGSYRIIIPKVGDRFTPPVQDFPIIKHSHHSFFFKYRKKKVLLLIRDLRDASLSQWRKYCARNKANMSFDKFLKKLPTDELDGKHDIIRRVRFLNSWGGGDAQLHVVYYEDLLSNGERELTGALSHLGIAVDSVLVKSVLRDCDLKKSHTLNMNSIITNRNRLADRAYFQGEAGEVFKEVVGARLKADFGYDYT